MLYFAARVPFTGVPFVSSCDEVGSSLLVGRWQTRQTRENLEIKDIIKSLILIQIEPQ
jgi:hypothetical protein